MKKILFILFLTLVACKKTLPVVTPITANIFSVAQSSIQNGQEIQFDLTKNGVYTLTLIDSITNQVVTRERFNGQIGQNKKKIYTKGIESKYLYLLLEDVTKNKISKTTIIIN